MVASDYAIKVINLLYPGDRATITHEHQWRVRVMREEMAVV